MTAVAKRCRQAEATLLGTIDAWRFRLQVSGDPIIDPPFINMLP